MLRRSINASVLAAGTLCLAGQLRAQSSAGLLVRRYHDGDSLHYRMDGTNQHPGSLRRYSARTDGVVRRDTAGRFVEEIDWSHLMRNDSEVAIPVSAAHQRLTLEPGVMLPPDMAHINPALIGPALDLFTFYVDLWLSAKLPLRHAGDHIRVPGHGANSWADGQHVVLGEDAVDFDITLGGVDSAAGTVQLDVRHVPTTDSHVRLPAAWMRAPLFDTPSNWVQVTHAADGSYVAGVGRETFDVQLVVSLVDGRIISATMDNPVDVLERVCSDAELASCGDESRYRIFRHVTLR